MKAVVVVGRGKGVVLESGNENIYVQLKKKKLQSEYLRNTLALLLSIKEGVHQTCPKALPLTLDYKVAVEKKHEPPRSPLLSTEHCSPARKESDTTE